MKLFFLSACTFGIHRRDRNSVWRDGPRYRAVCAGCGTAMVRDTTGWHRAPPATD